MFHRIAYSSSIIDSFDVCLADCLETLKRLKATNTLLGVVFFVDAKSPDSFQEANQAIKTALRKHEMLLPFNVLAQAGCCPVSMEVWLDHLSSKTEYLTHKGIRYARFQGETGVSICTLGLCHNNMQASIQDQANETFRLLVEMLQKEGLSLSDIVRQWNYIPGILTQENTQGKIQQHYQAFNEVRKHWYGKELFTDGYPAATGIGVKTGPFSIDVIAMTSNPSLKKTGIYNPKQVNAYQYAQHHLVGEPLYGKQKNPPLFERAKLLDSPTHSMVFVSGTAAILGQETVGVDDVSKQTEVSINNMMELITPVVTRINQPFRFNYIRVYIKEAAQRDTVKSLCENYFPEIPKSFVVADVCRDNLLMEIEGEAVSQS